MATLYNLCLTTGQMKCWDSDLNCPADSVTSFQVLEKRISAELQVSLCNHQDTPLQLWNALTNLFTKDSCSSLVRNLVELVNPDQKSTNFASTIENRKHIAALCEKSYGNTKISFKALNSLFTLMNLPPQLEIFQQTLLHQLNEKENQLSRKF